MQKWLILIFFLIIVLVVGCHKPAALFYMAGTDLEGRYTLIPEPELKPQPKPQDQLLTLHNQQRGNLFPLSLDGGLMQLAQTHANWMAQTNILRHQNLLISRTIWTMMGENIASGQRSETEVVQAWMDSSGHRRNILSPRYTRMGHGMAISRSGIIYWCVVFGG